MTTIFSPTLPERFFYALPAAVMSSGLITGLCLAPEKGEVVGTVLLAASILFCGLPHGAGDLWAIGLAGGQEAGSLRTRVIFIVAYLVAALLTLAVWHLDAAAALGGFLVLTAWHFGSADALLLTGGRAGGAAWWAQAVGRGAMIISLPLAFYREESTRLLAPFALQNPGSLLNLLRFLLIWAPTIAGASLGLQGLVALPRLLASKTGAVTLDRLRAAASLGESCLIAGLFWCAPPLLAFACYWIGAHAWRHILRLEALQLQAEASVPGSVRSVWQVLRNYHERTLGLTLSSVAGLVVIFLAWPELATGANGWVTAYFILLSALTVPHALVIAYLDWKTGTASAVALAI